LHKTGTKVAKKFLIKRVHHHHKIPALTLRAAQGWTLCRICVENCMAPGMGRANPRPGHRQWRIRIAAEVEGSFFVVAVAAVFPAGFFGSAAWPGLSDSFERGLKRGWKHEAFGYL
jgi:hypothetical protein